MTTLQRRCAGTALAIAVGGCLLAGRALADTVTRTTSVGLEPNRHGQECALGFVVGPNLTFGRATWSATERRIELAAGGVKNVVLMVVNTKSNRLCRVDVRGTALSAGDESVPIHDLKLEEGERSAVAVETVAQVPDQAVPEVPAWLIAAAGDGQRAVVKATLGGDHLAHLPAGTYTGLLTLTGSANAP